MIGADRVTKSRSRKAMKSSGGVILANMLGWGMK
jgi:hypothetical protein